MNYSIPKSLTDNACRTYYPCNNYRHTYIYLSIYLSRERESMFEMETHCNRLNKNFFNQYKVSKCSIMSCFTCEFYTNIIISLSLLIYLQVNIFRKTLLHKWNINFTVLYIFSSI